MASGARKLQTYEVTPDVRKRETHSVAPDVHKKETDDNMPGVRQLFKHDVASGVHILETHEAAPGVHKLETHVVVYYGSTTLGAEFWPSQLLPSILLSPGQGSSNLALLTSVYLF